MSERCLRRSIAVTSCMVLLALCVGLRPGPTRAAVKATTVLADKNESFSAGFFSRTGFASSDIGGVQLVPIKVTTAWTPSSSTLPLKLRSHSSVVYRDRIFVVGGNTLDGQGFPIKSSAFLTTRMANTQGALEPWAGQPTLPGLPEAVADPGSVIVEVAGKPYLFVLGGLRGYTTVGAGNFDDVTTANMYYYPIGETSLTGHTWTQPLISGTSDPARLPYGGDHECYQSPCNPRGGGASGLAAFSVTIGTTPYIYVFGGSTRTFSFGTYYTLYSSAVYRAPVSLSGGRLQLGAWSQISDIQGSDGVAKPLARSAAAAFTDPTNGSKAIYLIGGELQLTPGASVTNESNAYIAHIASNGTLTWKNNGNMSETRTGHAAVQAKGQITLSGGTANGVDPTATMGRGYILDDYTLYREQTYDPSFELVEVVGQTPRMRHTMATLDAGTTGSLAYMIGGQTSTDLATDHVLMGNLDAPATTSDKFVPSGKYFSKIFNFGRDAEYLTLNWKAIMPADTTLQLQFRVGNDPASLGPLQAVPVSSADGNNAYAIPPTASGPVTGQYFQFVATFTRPESTDPAQARITPILDWVSLEVNRAGFPNLKVAAPNGAGFSLDPLAPIVTITNKAFRRADGTTLPVLDANWEREGSFFVALYVFDPGVTPQRPQLGDGGVAYAAVRRSSLPVDAEYTVPNDNTLRPGTNYADNIYTWRPSSCGENCPLVNWRNIFDTAGTYNVYVMVDAINDPTLNYGIIQEADAAGTDGESDNIFGPFPVQIETSLSRAFVPLLSYGTPSSIAATQAAPAAPQRWIEPLK